jgi:hypothetical protein
MTLPPPPVRRRFVPNQVGLALNKTKSQRRLLDAEAFKPLY